MRIAYLSDITTARQFGGAQKIMEIEARMMAKLGHEVHILSLSPTKKSHSNPLDNDRNKIVTHYLGRVLFDPYEKDTLGNKLVMSSLGILNPTMSYRVAKTLQKINPDPLHSHYAYRISYGAVSISSRRLKIPWIHTFHDYLFECPKGSMLRSSGKVCLEHPVYCSIRNKSFKRVFGQPDSIIAISDFVRMRLISAGYERDKITLLHNPISVGQHNSAVGFDPFVLYVGRLEQSKGILQFARHFMEASSYTGELVIAGTGSLEQALRKLADESGGKIRVLGKVPQPELERLYARCRCLVFPSIWPEVMPATPLEAMTYGKPVVGTCIGGTPEIVMNNVNGYCVPPEDFGLLTEKCLQLIGDEKLSRDFGHQAINVARGFTLEEHATSLARIYESLRHQN